MTGRQMRWERGKKQYNADLKNKSVEYLGCKICYKNPAGYGYYAVETPWIEPFSWIHLEQFKSISEAKRAIKRTRDKMNNL